MASIDKPPLGNGTTRIPNWFLWLFAGVGLALIGGIVRYEFRLATLESDNRSQQRQIDHLLYRLDRLQKCRPHDKIESCINCAADQLAWPILEPKIDLPSETTDAWTRAGNAVTWVAGIITALIALAALAHLFR